MKTENKLAKLTTILKEMRSVLVAYSGGTDSTFLTVTAHEVLGDKLMAVFAFSALTPLTERDEAKEIARQGGFRYKITSVNVMNNPDFTANSPDRCYYCRQELFRELKIIAEFEGLKWVADGMNHDDLTDYRPGRKSAVEAGIRSPLSEAGLTKTEIRMLSKEKGLPTWDKPASPCLASRIPYGTPVTADTLTKIAEGEKYLHSLGLGQLRLRHHGDIARLELDEKEMKPVMSNRIRHEIIEHLKSLGYKYVTLDMNGYRTGSLNIGIKQE
ncbi:MAG: ATP-dependent sacrificial sulfur transferase LarE [Dehalococcoidales bacterium]|nr:ATP-dependent sacrificial sulfur transferase LarE [Dehalococcoidales bacterium]